MCGPGLESDQGVFARCGSRPVLYFLQARFSAGLFCPKTSFTCVRSRAVAPDRGAGEWTTRPGDLTGELPQDPTRCLNITAAEVRFRGAEPDQSVSRATDY